MTEYGPLIPFQVTWRSGHIETIHAHQVLWPQQLLFGLNQTSSRRVLIHGEVDGVWQLLLAADEADILSVRRLMTADEPT